MMSVNCTCKKEIACAICKRQLCNNSDCTGCAYSVDSNAFQRHTKENAIFAGEMVAVAKNLKLRNYTYKDKTVPLVCGDCRDAINSQK
jgi:hypothetical protein